MVVGIASEVPRNFLQDLFAPRASRSKSLDTFWKQRSERTRTKWGATIGVQCVSSACGVRETTVGGAVERRIASDMSHSTLLTIEKLVLHKTIPGSVKSEEKAERSLRCGDASPDARQDFVANLGHCIGTFSRPDVTEPRGVSLFWSTRLCDGQLLGASGNTSKRWTRRHPLCITCGADRVAVRLCAFGYSGNTSSGSRH